MKLSLTTTLAFASISLGSSQDLQDIPTTISTSVSNSFSNLVAALEAANLVETLSGDGPYTVFAPTDDAFAVFPPDLVTCLLQPENVDALTQILTYHVADGNVVSTDLSNGMQIPMLEGSPSVITIEDATVKVNDAKIIVADVASTNGVIHVINGVLVPPSFDAQAFMASCGPAPVEEAPVVVEEEEPVVEEEEPVVETENPTSSPVELKDIPTTAEENGGFTTLLAALEAADLTETLSGDGPFTVFAPTDDAFASLPEELTTCLMLPENVDVLSKVLAYHAAEGYVLSTDLFDGMEIPTLEGSSSTITIEDDTVKVDGAKVLVADVVASNGVIHVIGGVLVPPTVDMQVFMDMCQTPAEEEPQPAKEDDKSSSTMLSTTAALFGVCIVTVLSM